MRHLPDRHDLYTYYPMIPVVESHLSKFSYDCLIFDVIAPFFLQNLMDFVWNLFHSLEEVATNDNEYNG